MRSRPLLFLDGVLSLHGTLALQEERDQIIPEKEEERDQAWAHGRMVWHGNIEVTAIPWPCLDGKKNCLKCAVAF
jgi:hypothetical protein